jgi:signal transduction histidine kinase
MESMTPHRALDRWIRTHPLRVDLILALGLWGFFVVVGEVATSPFDRQPLVRFAVGSLQVLPLAWRRSRPGTSAALVVLGCLLQLALVDRFMASQVAVPVAVYALAAYGARWQSFAGLAAGFAGALLASLRYGGSGGPTDLGIGFVGIALIVLVSWTFGDLTRTRRLAVQALRDRARRLEVERQQERDLAAADERSRIAREMHDIVAHSLSVVIAQADGARYASAADPEIARETLGTIAATGRTSLREMRRLLGVLRGDEAASTRPLPGLRDLPDLLETVRRTGLDAGFSTDGAPRRPLPAGAELTAYRAVQEGLTNVLKHAGPDARADVVLSWTAAGLQATVSDDGRGAAADESTAGSRQGLRGMAERAALYDGRFSAGPRPAGGFAASIFIPHTED